MRARQRADGLEETPERRPRLVLGAGRLVLGPPARVVDLHAPDGLRPSDRRAETPRLVGPEAVLVQLPGVGVVDGPVEHRPDRGEFGIRLEERGQVTGYVEAGAGQGVVPVDAHGLQPSYERGLDVDELVRDDFGEAEPVAEGVRRVAIFTGVGLSVGAGWAGGGGSGLWGWLGLLVCLPVGWDLVGAIGRLSSGRGRLREPLFVPVVGQRAVCREWAVRQGGSRIPGESAWRGMPGTRTRSAGTPSLTAAGPEVAPPPGRRPAGAPHRTVAAAPPGDRAAAASPADEPWPAAGAVRLRPADTGVRR